MLELNLGRLKKSNKVKRLSIYHKACGIISENWETDNLTDLDIHVIASRYPTLKVSIKAGGIIIVESRRGEWMIVDEGRFIVLYHQGTGKSKGKIRTNYHIQDVFYDLEYVFASIESHDDYRMGIRKRNVKDIEYMIHSRNIEFEERNYMLN